MYLIYRLLIRHFIFIFLILPFTTRAIFDLDMVANDLVINNLPVNDFSANELDTNNFPADNIGTDYCLNDPDGCFSENQFMNDVSLKNDDFANSLFAADPIVDDVQSCRQPSRKLKDRGVAGGRFCANTEDLDLPSDTFVTRKDLITFWCPALLNSAPGIWPVCNRSVVTGDNYYPIIEAYLLTPLNHISCKYDRVYCYHGWNGDYVDDITAAILPPGKGYICYISVGVQLP